jgi:DNA-binding HxlR family transcriptional regulator
MARTADYSKQSCSIAATLEVVGDAWTLLIIREGFSGVRRFEDWQTRLGLARNVLASRLKTLVQHGVLERRLYSQRPPRHEYRMTAKGRDLYPLMMALTAWGDKHAYADSGSPSRMIHTTCGADIRPVVTCAECHEPIRPTEIRMQKGEAPTVGEVLRPKAA